MENFKNQLKQGDIILHHAHGWLSNIIRDLDQSYYNHCSIYDKDGFLYESIKGGIKRKTIEESIKNQKTSLITIFRSKNADQKKMKLLIDTIEAYPKNTFAYSQMCLLASILWKRKQNLNGLWGKFANLLFLVFEKIIFLFVDRKNTNMICSELVYRSYMDVAKKHNDVSFTIHIPIECSPLFVFENEEIKKEYPCDFEYYEKNNLETVQQNTFVDDKNEIKSSTFKNYITNLFSTGNYDLLSIAKYSPNENKAGILGEKNIKASRILKSIKLYNFVTPGDIARSLDTYAVATYKTDTALNFKNCQVCNN